MRDETTGLVSPDSVPVGPTGEPVVPEGEEHPVTGLVYAFFRSTDEPMPIELVADRAYVGWGMDEDVAEDAQEDQEDDEDKLEHETRTSTMTRTRTRTRTRRPARSSTSS